MLVEIFGTLANNPFHKAAAIKPVTDEFITKVKNNINNYFKSNKTVKFPVDLNAIISLDFKAKMQLQAILCAFANEVLTSYNGKNSCDDIIEEAERDFNDLWTRFIFKTGELSDEPKLINNLNIEISKLLNAKHAELMKAKLPEDEDSVYVHNKYLANTNKAEVITLIGNYFNSFLNTIAEIATTLIVELPFTDKVKSYKITTTMINQCMNIINYSNGFNHFNVSMRNNVNTYIDTICSSKKKPTKAKVVKSTSVEVKEEIMSETATDATANDIGDFADVENISEVDNVGEVDGN